MLPEYATVVRYSTTDRHRSICRDQQGGRFKYSLLNSSGRSRQNFSRLIISFFTLLLLILFLQTFGQFDQGELRLRFTFPEVVMFAELEQGGHPGFQLDVRGSVLVGSQSLDEVTQAQSFDQPQVHPPCALVLDDDEIQQVGGRDVGNAGQNLVGSDGGRCHAGSDGGPNCTVRDQPRPLLFRPSIPSLACGIDGGPRRFTQVVLNEQSLLVV